MGPVKIALHILLAKGIIDARVIDGFLPVVVIAKGKVKTGFAHVVRVKGRAYDRAVPNCLCDIAIAIDCHGALSPLCSIVPWTYRAIPVWRPRLPYKPQNPASNGRGFYVYPGVRDLAVAYFYLDTRAHCGANGD